MKRPQHGHVVGNGGQGIEENGKLYPRDLFEAGIHLRPYIGWDASSELIDQVTSFQFADLPLDRALLAHKLSDINSIFPELGCHLLRALNLYDWVRVTEPLPRTDECDGTPGCKDHLVQIANRVQDAIYIHAPSWARLHPVNQVGLLIHEAVYSLLKPEKDRESFAKQVGAKARRLTGMFFDERTFHSLGRDASDLKRHVQDLSTPLLVQAPVQLHLAPQFWTLSLHNLNTNGTESQIRLPLHRVRSMPDVFFDNVCAELGRWQKRDNTEIRSRLELEPFESGFATYDTRHGLKQFAVTIRERRGARYHDLVYTPPLSRTIPEFVWTHVTMAKGAGIAQGLSETGRRGI